MTQRRTMPAEMQGKITEDGVARMRARIGVLIPQPPPYNTEATFDTMRHFAHGYGEDNPLFTDTDYGKATRWRGLIAAPLYVQTMGITTVKEIPPEIRKKGAGALTGVPNYLSGSSWEFFRPIYPGDVIFQRYFISDVQEKRSEFGGGKAVVVYHRREYTNRAGEIVTTN
ncbi:MAG: MaoC family dehydratase N-terminal domain-containing protein, partial [Chloroflexi bacterium]|nr:MaoC family dehydratase N-terminal domain-containing protein [Chloroflexota bacterium]